MANVLDKTILSMEGNGEGEKMDAKTAWKTVKAFTVQHAPTIVMGLGISGFITTVGLAIKVSPKGKEILDKMGTDATTMDKIKALAPVYWPVALTGTVSIGCFIFANSMNLKRNAAAIAAYQISETALNEFKEASLKTVGEKKTREIETKVAEEKIKNDPPTEKTIIVTGNGDQLCYDTVTERYFMSTIEKIRQAVNNVNYKLMLENSVSLNEFYDELNLPHWVHGDKMGWTMYKQSQLLDIKFDSVLTNDGRAALALIYKVAPTWWYED